MTTPSQAAQPTYIWQQPGWPKLVFDTGAVAHDLNVAHLQMGRVLGLLDAIGLTDSQEITRELWVQEAIATAAIEGEQLDLTAVRSSVAHRLGLADAPTRDRHVDGLVAVMQDATSGHQSVLDSDRLCRWQSALFYTAPASDKVAAEMAKFLAWFEATRPTSDAAPSLNGLARAALAHLWFESIHPFEDGNGRLGRAIVDLALAQAVGAPARLLGMSRQLLAVRAAYYDALNRAQSGGPDVTPWVQWFVQAFTQGCIQSQAVVKQALDKASFRQRATSLAVNERQSKVLNRLLEAGSSELGGGFLGGMTAEKYSQITGISKATATRDLSELLRHGLLKVEGVGKATRYAVNVEGWNQPTSS